MHTHIYTHSHILSHTITLTLTQSNSLTHIHTRTYIYDGQIFSEPGWQDCLEVLSGFVFVFHDYVKHYREGTEIQPFKFGWKLQSFHNFVHKATRGGIYMRRTDRNNQTSHMYTNLPTYLL